MSRFKNRDPGYPTRDAPGLNGNPAGSVIRGTPRPLDPADMNSGLQASQYLADLRASADPAAAVRAIGQASTNGGDTMTEGGQDLVAHTALDRFAESGRQLSSAMQPAAIAALVRIALAEQGIGPTSMGGVSDRVQQVELTVARDLTKHREEIDTQHDRLARLEATVMGQLQDANAAMMRIRETLGLDACASLDTIVAEVAKRCRWSEPDEAAIKAHALASDEDSTPRVAVSGDAGVAVEAEPAAAPAEPDVRAAGLSRYTDLRDVPMRHLEVFTRERSKARIEYLETVQSYAPLSAAELSELEKLKGLGSPVEPAEPVVLKLRGIFSSIMGNAK